MIITQKLTLTGYLLCPGIKKIIANITAPDNSGITSELKEEIAGILSNERTSL
jgi:hypothetical protein